jgi:hypothetical protein
MARTSSSASAVISRAAASSWRTPSSERKALTTGSSRLSSLPYCSSCEGSEATSGLEMSPATSS